MLFVNRGTCVNDLPRVAALRDSGTVGSRMRVQHVVHSLGYIPSSGLTPRIPRTVYRYF